MSGTSNSGGPSLLSNMKAMIASQDQKMQDKLRALHDFKDSMTYPINMTQLGLPSKDSFNRTKIINKNFENSAQQNWYCDNYSQQRVTTETEEQNDEELEKLRLKYLDEEDNKNLENSQRIKNYDHYRNNSQVYEANKEDKISQRTSLNKSFEIGSQYRQRSWQTNNQPIEKKNFFTQMLQKSQIYSPNSFQMTKIDDEDRQETCNTDEDDFLIDKVKPDLNQFNRHIPPKPKSNLRFPLFALDKNTTTSQKEQNKLNQLIQEDSTAVTDHAYHMSDTTNPTYSNITGPKQYQFHSQNHRKVSSMALASSSTQNISLPPSKGLTKHEETNIDNFDQIKSHLRDQSCMLAKLQGRVDQSESDITMSISKSVERVTSQLQVLSQQFKDQKLEEESRFNTLYKQVKDIKHHYKKRAKRHSKRNLEKDESLNTPMMGPSNQNSQEQIKSNYLQDQRQTNSHVRNPSQQESMIPQSQYNQYSRSPNIGCNSKDQTNYRSHYQVNHKFPLELNNPSNIPQLSQDQKENDVYYDFQTLNEQNLTLINDQKTNKYHQRQSSNAQYNNQSHGHTISFNTEIEKVKEESQKNMHDMKSFYETQLQNIRQEFEQREAKLKDKMKGEIQESMKLERSKLNDQLLLLEREKQSLIFRLSNQPPRDNSTTFHSKNQSLTSYISESNNHTLHNLHSNQNLVKQEHSNQDPVLQEKQLYDQKPQLYTNQMLNQPSEMPSERKESKRKIQESKKIRDYSKINQTQILNQTSQRKKPTESKVKNHLNMSTQYIRPHSIGLKENVNMPMHGSNTKVLNDSKLQVKEKEILRRINKIENFLNR